MSLVETAHLRQFNTWRYLGTHGARLAAKYARQYKSFGREETERHVDELAVLRDVAATGATFALEADVAVAVFVAAQKMPHDAQLRREDVVEERGFVWGAEPLLVPPYVVPDEAWIPLDIQGIAWRVSTSTGFGEDGQPEPVHGAFIEFLGSSESLAEVAGIPPAERTAGVAICLYSIFWRFGDTLDDMMGRSRRRAEDMNLPDTFFTDEDAQRRCQYIHAFWLFVQQRVLVRRRVHVNRQLIRAAARAKFEASPAVEVVELRRRAASHSEPLPEGLATEREWSCRWLVGGHWRKQWYPTAQTHKTIWIAPFVKGPDDKPFKAPGHRVYHVVR